ncbi:MAG: hypothetical protein OWV35_07700, partial [Firmicutes bacterium]|nr:hypothetical protein [Bacillota bacterium]
GGRLIPLGLWAGSAGPRMPVADPAAGGLGVRVLFPAGRRWRAGAPLRLPSGRLSAAEAGNGVVVAWSGPHHRPRLERWSPAGGWQGGPLQGLAPGSRVTALAVSLGGRVYLAAGGHGPVELYRLGRGETVRPLHAQVHL